MYLATELLQALDKPGLSLSERAQLFCRLAKHHEQAGDYEAASEALTEFWQGVGARPNVQDLDDAAKAEVLLRTGAITGWIGSASKIEGAQEAAKDLMSESLRLFQARGMKSKAGQARSDLALCYWRTGAYDEARVMLEEAYRDIDARDIEQRATTLLRQALVERESKRLNTALQFHNEAKPLFERIENPLLTAHYHHSLANVLNRLSSAEDRQDYVDLALIEYEAASFYFEQAGHQRYQACVENNIGYLLGDVGKFDAAHEHLDRATVLITRLKDNVRLGQFDETRARVFLAEGRNVEAEKAARVAVALLENGDKSSWLAEALTTHGIALARLNHADQSRAVLDRAVDVAEQAGDFQNAGVAALTIIEQIGKNLSTKDLCEIIDHARSLLEKTQDISTLRRLARAAFQGLFVAHTIPAPPDWKDFSFNKAVLRFEAHLIRMALMECKGSVTRAARLLGFKHHQSLIALIDGRHKDLMSARLPRRPRRKHLIEHPKK